MKKQSMRVLKSLLTIIAILVVVLASSQPGHAALGDINTVAGNGTFGFSGDGAQATSAMLNYPNGVAVDSSGNIYIACNNRIRKVAINGVITTVAGNTSYGGFSGDGGPATSAMLDSPHGVAVDSSGNIYIADTFNNRIRKVATNGVITTLRIKGTPYIIPLNS